MHIIRKIGLVIAAALLPIFLFTGGFIFSTYNMYGSPTRIKDAFNKSGIYDTFVSDILDAQQKGEGQEADTEIPINDPRVKQVVKDAASPEFLRTQVENVLDGMYAWARGTSSSLAFTIDLTEAKTKLTDGLTRVATERLATLPPCQAIDAKIANEFNPLSAECVPRGTDTSAAVNKIRDQLNNELFKDTIITASDIKSKDRTLQQQLSELPGVYDQIVFGQWASMALVIVLATAIIGLSRPWQKGLKRTGIIFVSVGGASVILAIAGAFLFKRLAQSVVTDDLQAGYVNIANILADGFRAWWVGYGVIIVLLGVAMLISLKFIKKSTASTESNVEKPAEHQDSSTSSPPKPPKTK